MVELGVKGVKGVKGVALKRNKVAIKVLLQKMDSLSKDLHRNGFWENNRAWSLFWG